MKTFDSRNEALIYSEKNKKLMNGQGRGGGGERKVPLIWDLRVPLLKSNEIRVSVTYLITITTEIAKLDTREMFCNHQIAKLNTCEM